MSPECQRFTLRWVWRTISIIDSHGFVDSSVRFSEPVIAEPGERQRLLACLRAASRRRRGSVRSSSPASTCSWSSARRVIVERPRRAQPGLTSWPVALGQVVEHVAFLVPDAALHGRLAEDVADRLAQRLGAVDHEQDALLGVEAALDEVGEQRGRDGRVLGRAFPEPERDLDALGGDPERDDVACGP